MALTGLFLCVFLLGHLAGNLQLFVGGYEGRLLFNEYGVFMTTFPAVKILSYLTYFSIFFHAVDGIMLTIANRKARPTKYAYSKPGVNSSFSSRNMAILGSLVLLFIVMHMSNFWYRYHFDSEMPYMLAEHSDDPLLQDGTVVKGGTVDASIVYGADGNPVGPVMKDLYEIVSTTFQEPLLVGLYLVGLLALAFHLWHGFSSGFQSLGLNHPTYTPIIKKLGYLFAVVLPVLFALIPVYMFVVL